MSEEDMQFLRRLAMAIDAKVCSEVGGENRYSVIAIENKHLPLAQRVLHYYIIEHEKLREKDGVRKTNEG